MKSLMCHRCVIVMYVFGVSYHKINGKKAGKRAKKYPFLYYYDQDLNWHSKRNSRFEAFFRKFQKKKRFKYTCSSCNRSFMAINQKKKDIKCPYCD